MKSRNILFACVFALCAGSALAQSPRWYAGVSAGQSRTSDDLVSNRESTVVNAVSVRSDFDSTDSAWKVFGGYRFNEMLAFEVSYADLGRHRLATHIVGGFPEAPGAVIIGRKISGFGADLVLGMPVASRFSVFAKAGAFRSRLEADATLEGSLVFTNNPGDRFRTVTQDETVLKYGVGGEWLVRPDIAVRLEWERYHDIGKAFAVGGSGTTGEADTDLVSVGLTWRF
jgi:OOP family OmpA-OmpF porin